jgi:endonuclease/exonuclease/phosphatase (EEP) superfamily protein YafD
MSRLRPPAVLLAWGVALGALAAAVVLTAVRLGDPSRPRLVELVAFTPLALGFALLAALVAGGLLLARVRGAGIAAVAGLLLTALHVWWLAPLYGGEASAALPGPRLVVMTQNLEYGDGAMLGRLVADEGVDLLVVTDTDPERLADLIDSGVEERLPYSVGIGPDGPDRTVVLSRYPLGQDAWISDGGSSRIVPVVVPGLGRLDLVAVHPAPPYLGAAWSADYRRVLEALEDRYGDDTDRSVVLAGDFNATLDHAPMRRITGMGFADAVEQLNRGWSPTWPADGSQRRFGIPVPAMVQIDHVLTSSALVATEVTTSGLAGSDHRAVVATLAPTG